MIASPDYSLFLVMACFWIVFILVSTQLIKPLGKLIDDRELRVSGAREEYGRAHDAMAQTVARCERELAEAAGEAQHERASLRAAGEDVRRSKLDAARAQGQERLASLAEQLQAAGEDARLELRERAGSLSRELAEQLLGRSLAS